MNNIIKQEITVVQNKEGAIFKVGDIVKKAVKGRTDDFVTPSKIISFNCRLDKKQKTIITAITDFKYQSGALHKTGICIDKIELCDESFPTCFKIRSLGSRSNNQIFIDKLNKIIIKKHFSGDASFGFYYLNLETKLGSCSESRVPEGYVEVTVEQFLRYCENEKI